ncbi:MAG: hypothetical protein FWC42_11105 [Proteobacteria bacterium]|nr:hypothetical protein [Pseudomonadota bacterium]
MLEKQIVVQRVNEISVYAHPDSEFVAISQHDPVKDKYSEVTIPRVYVEALIAALKNTTS